VVLDLMGFSPFWKKFPYYTAGVMCTCLILSIPGNIFLSPLSLLHLDILGTGILIFTDITYLIIITVYFKYHFKPVRELDPISFLASNSRWAVFCSLGTWICFLVAYTSFRNPPLDAFFSLLHGFLLVGMQFFLWRIKKFLVKSSQSTDLGGPIQLPSSLIGNTDLSAATRLQTESASQK